MAISNAHKSDPLIAERNLYGAPSGHIKRRSSRVVIDIPVSVFGQDLNGRVFREDAVTTSVSAQGALLTLSSEVGSEKPLLLINRKSGNETQCRVAYKK